MLVSSSALIPIPVSKYISLSQNTTGTVLTSDNNAAANTAFVLYSLDGHIQWGNTIIEVFLRKSSEAELLKSIVGVGNQFPEENISKDARSGPEDSEGVHIQYLFE